MSDPQKNLVFNMSERAISTDHNRLQQFQAAFLAEVWRAMADTSSATDDLDAAGVDTQNTTTGSPDSAIVFNGLRVVPAIGNFNMTVTPGTIGMLDPDASPDPSDSPYKLIEDAGLPSPGTIAIAPNTSGQTRIDLIICTRTSIVLETDSRDIFNNVSGLFTPTTVNKVQAGALSYSVVQGTPGAGMPAIPVGCVPLCVASVPNGTTSNDSITFWDVRPMLEDLIFSPFQAGSDMPRWHPSASLVVNPTGLKSILTGFCEVTASDGSAFPTVVPGKTRLGGRLRRGTPGTDFPVSGIDGLDIADVANQSSVSAGETCYLYLCEPLGLPRWARYTDASTGTRKPRSPRGIPVVSAIKPVHLYGCPQSPIALPSSMGLTGTSTAKASCLMVLGTNGFSNQIAGAVVSGRRAWIDQAASTAFNNSIGPALRGGALVTFTLTGGTNVPDIARVLEFTVVLTNGSGGSVPGNQFTITSADLIDPTTGNVLCSGARNVTSSDQDASSEMRATFQIAWPAQYAQGVSSAVRTLQVNFTQTGWSVSPSAAALFLVSWEQF